MLIRIAAFLAQFELSLQQLDLHLKADDAADQAIGVTLGQLGEVVAGGGALKLGDEPGEHVVQGLRIRDGLEPSGGVNHGEIPGGHGFRLAVPGGRDVTVRTAEHDYRRLLAVKTLALQVLARDVAEDGAVGRGGSIQDCRDVRDADTGAGCDEIGESEFVHEVLQELAVFDEVRLGDIERAGRWLLRLQIEAGGGQGEQQVAAVSRTPEQERYLENSVAQFWDAVDRTFALARDPNQTEARTQIRISLRARQEALSTAVSRLLVQNNESEEQAALRIRQIYDGVQRQAYLFLTATLIAILFTSLYLIRSNRRLFAQLAALSEQRSELAQKLITTQESTLRHISRELHDEFGQILTAVGAMLTRAGKHAPEGSQLRAELREVCEIMQSALDKVRSLSQALHPVMLEETGLESTLDWYLPVVERQAGIRVFYEKSGESFPVDGSAAIHVYRVVQEALNNVTRHSGTGESWVRLRFLPQALEVEVEDHGKGFEAQAARQGIGLVAMRERAELMGGMVEFLRPAQDGSGTLVRLKVPREKLEA